MNVTFSLRRRLALVLLITAVSLSTVHSQSLTGADDTLKTLASAFARKDSAAISKLVDDGWSGLRFCEGWSDGQWQAAANALRSAKLQSRTQSEQIYSVTLRWPNDPADYAKVISLHLGQSTWDGSTWKLDLNSFLGPFPHL